MSENTALEPSAEKTTSTLDNQADKNGPTIPNHQVNEGQTADNQPDTSQPHTGLVVRSCRNDHGLLRWVFRCWGTDTCDGSLSLDHVSENSATSARDRHIAEAHPELVDRALREYRERAQLVTNTLTEVLAAFRPVTDTPTRTLVGYLSDPVHPADMDRWRTALKERPGA